MLVVLGGISALVIDVGRAYYTKRALQAQADASALAGAQRLPDPAQASALARQDSGSSGSKNVQSGVKAVDTSVTVRCSPSGSSCPTANSVQVVEHAQVGTLLARVLGINTFDIKAKATACVAGWQSSYLIDDQKGSYLAAPPCTFG